MSIPSNQQAATSHIDYFDPLRLMATVSVVFMHAGSTFLQGTAMGVQWELLNVCISFAFTAVPLFLMMSGYLLLSSQRTTDISLLLQKRLPRLFFPLVGWTVIAVLQRLSAQGNLTWADLWAGLLRSLYEPAAVHFWYMYLIIALYVLSPFLYGAVQSLDHGGRRFGLALIAIVTLHQMAVTVLPSNMQALLYTDLFFKLKIYEGHLCTFLLGCCLGSLKREVPNRALIPAAIALWAAIAAGTHFLTVQRGAYASAYQTQAAGFEVALAACLFLLFKNNVKRPSKLLRSIPIIPLCLPIYFMHGILLAALQNAGHYPSSFGEVAGMTALLFAASYLLSKTIATIKPLCFLLTGMSYPSACKSCNWIYTYRILKAKLRPQVE